jgi:hypothetical protein
MSAGSLIKKHHWLLLLIFVPLVTSGAVIFFLMRARASDPGLAAAEIMSDMVAGRSLARRDIRDDHDKPLTAAQKDRLCYDIFHPALKGQRVLSEQIINYKNGMGEVKAVLVDANGTQTVFMLPTIKSPEGVVIHLASLLRPIWNYQANPKALPNMGSAELFNRRAPFVRETAPRLEAIGIKEIQAEDGEFYPVSELGDVYAAWQ